MGQPDIALAPPLVAHGATEAGDLVVVGQDHPAFGRRELLVRIERKDRGGPKRASSPTLVLGANGLAAIGDNLESISPGYVFELVVPRRLPETIDNENGPRTRSDCRLHECRIHVVRLWLDVDEHRTDTHIQSAVA